MQTNVFLGASPDPLLGGTSYNTPTDYDTKIAELQAMQQKLEQQKQQTNYFQKANSSPMWDEIEKITAELSDHEFAIINGNEDFQKSEANIATIIQREQMRIMRPIVEATADGKKALEEHLNLIKRLKKDASREVFESIEAFNDYTQNHPNLTYAEYLKMKKATNTK